MRFTLFSLLEHDTHYTKISVLRIEFKSSKHGQQTVLQIDYACCCTEAMQGIFGTMHPKRNLPIGPDLNCHTCYTCSVFPGLSARSAFLRLDNAEWVWKISQAFEGGVLLNKHSYCLCFSRLVVIRRWRRRRLET